MVLAAAIFVDDVRSEEICYALVFEIKTHTHKVTLVIDSAHLYTSRDCNFGSQQSTHSVKNRPEKRPVFDRKSAQGQPNECNEY